MPFSSGGFISHADTLEPIHRVCHPLTPSRFSDVPPPQRYPRSGQRYSWATARYSDWLGYVYFLVAVTEFERGGFRGGFGCRGDCVEAGDPRRFRRQLISTKRRMAPMSRVRTDTCNFSEGGRIIFLGIWTLIWNAVSLLVEN